MKISLPIYFARFPNLLFYIEFANPIEFGKGDICRSEVNHTEIGRAHIWKILNKIYQPYRIYGYPVHKVAPFENAGT